MIIPSPFDPVGLPDITVHAHALRRAGERSDHVAVVEGDSGVHTTFGDLCHLVDAWETKLRGWGVAARSVVLVSDSNRATTIAAMLAVMRIGATAAPVHPSASGDALDRAARSTGAAVLLTAPADERPRHVAAMPTDPSGRGDTLLGEGPGLVAHIGSGVASLDPSHLTGIALLPSTSGTGGTAKHVRTSHGNLVATAVLSDAVIPVAPDEAVYCLPSVTNCYGWTIAVRCLAGGATLVFPSGVDARSIVADFAGERITRAFVVPTTVAMLARSSGTASLSGRLRFILSGASALDPDVGRRCAEALGVPVIQGYGLTEASPTTHITPLHRSVEKRGSLGACLPNTVARLVDPESGHDCLPGAAGELWVSGPQVAAGYLGDASATEDVFRPDGWLRTGDLMRVDQDGYFTFVDRLKDVIKVRGQHVVPAELESVLLRHPSVAEAAVVGRSDDLAGELPVAFVVLRDDASTAELLEFAAARLPRHARIRRIYLTDALPRTPTGKVMRRALRESLSPTGR